MDCIWPHDSNDINPYIPWEFQDWLSWAQGKQVLPDVQNCFDVSKSTKHSRLIRAQSINATKGIPFPSVLSQWREGIPFPFCLLSEQGGNPFAILTHDDDSFLFLRAMGSLFFFLCFPFPHKRVENSLFSLHFSLRGEEGFRYSLYQFSALIFQYRNYFYVGWGCFTFFLPLWVQHFILQKYKTRKPLEIWLLAAAI